MAKKERFAIIRYVVDRLSDVRKTQVQKIIYFLQNIFSIPLDYVYKMHYYGPYSEELNSDLIDMRSSGYIDIASDPDGYGYHITTGEEPAGKIKDIKQEYITGLDKCLEELGDEDIRTLEILGAVHYVRYVAINPIKKKDEVIKKVARLKPTFNNDEIINAYQLIEDLMAKATP